MMRSIFLSKRNLLTESNPEIAPRNSCLKALLDSSRAFIYLIIDLSSAILLILEFSLYNDVNKD